MFPLLVALQTQLRGGGDDGLHGDGPRPQVRARPGGGERQVAGQAEELPGRVRVDPGQLWPGTHSLYSQEVVRLEQNLDITVERKRSERFSDNSLLSRLPLWM